MQLSTTHACSLSVPGAADGEKLAAAIVEALKKEEVEFHSEMEARRLEQPAADFSPRISAGGRVRLRGRAWRGGRT